MASLAGLAASYDRVRRFDLSDRAYREAGRYLSKRAEYTRPRYSYLLRGEPAKAHSQFLKAHELDPANPTINNNLQMLRDTLASDSKRRLRPVVSSRPFRSGPPGPVPDGSARDGAATIIRQHRSVLAHLRLRARALRNSADRVARTALRRIVRPITTSKTLISRLHPGHARGTAPGYVGRRFATPAPGATLISAATWDG